MIEVRDVLDGFDDIIVSSLILRRNLVYNIYNLYKDINLEDSAFSKETLLKIKFIVLIHNEIFKNISLEKEEFQNNPQCLQKHFYRNIEYARIYSDVEYFCQLIFEYEGLRNCVSELDNGFKNVALFNDIEKWLNNRLLIDEYELDKYEEELTLKLKKILDKGKEM